MIPTRGSPDHLRYTYWFPPLSLQGNITNILSRMHYSESNIVMLNVLALIFSKMPEKAPFFIKPLLRAIQAKAEQGSPSPPVRPRVPLPPFFPSPSTAAPEGGC